MQGLNGRGERGRLPRSVVWAVVGLCAAPLALHFVGVDFGTLPRPIHLQPADTAAYKAREVAFHLLSGAFTHTLLEWSAVATAIFTVSLSFVHFGIRRDAVAPVIGVGLFYAGCIDAFHTLAADHLIAAVADNHSFIPFTWMMSRLCNALIPMVGAGFFLVRRTHALKASTGFVFGVTLAFGGVTYAVIRYCATQPELPQTVFPDWLVGRPYDLIPLALYLTGGLLIYPAFHRRCPGYFSHALLISVIPDAATQLYMALGSATLFDSAFNVAHALKTVAYLVPFAGLVLEYIQTYREEQWMVAQLEKTQQELRHSSAETAHANEELMRRNAELDQFSYVASHDLQEPLRKLVVFSSMLQQDLGSELPEAAALDVHYIQDASTRMQELVRDLLDLSRTGRTEMEHEPVALDTCANSAIEALAVRVADTGAHITRDALPVVTGDATLFIQLYQNLIGNALKFVEAGPPAVHLTAERENGHWVLGVRDNGIGIKPEYAEQIFTPFKRLHGRTEFAGTGIGLAICRKAVERHGGRIWVESEPGHGAHFKFTTAAEDEDA